LRIGCANGFWKIGDTLGNPFYPYGIIRAISARPTRPAPRRGRPPRRTEMRLVPQANGDQGVKESVTFFFSFFFFPSMLALYKRLVWKAKK
jgi:hypothetical protein